MSVINYPDFIEQREKYTKISKMKREQQSFDFVPTHQLFQNCMRITLEHMHM